MHGAVLRPTPSAPMHLPRRPPLALPPRPHHRSNAVAIGPAARQPHSQPGPRLTFRSSLVCAPVWLTTRSTRPSPSKSPAATPFTRPAWRSTALAGSSLSHFVLQNPAGRSGGRPLREPHPHVPPQWSGPVRLPYHPAPKQPPGSGALAAMAPVIGEYYCCGRWTPTSGVEPNTSRVLTMDQHLVFCAHELPGLGSGHSRAVVGPCSLSSGGSASVV